MNARFAAATLLAHIVSANACAMQTKSRYKYEGHCQLLPATICSTSDQGGCPLPTLLEDCTLVCSSPDSVLVIGVVYGLDISCTSTGWLGKASIDRQRFVVIDTTPSIPFGCPSRALCDASRTSCQDFYFQRRPQPYDK